MGDGLVTAVVIAGTLLVLCTIALAWLFGRYFGYLDGLTDGAAAQAENDIGRSRALEELVSHMWVHDGYERNGYMQMTTEQKAMYDEITNREPD